MQANLDVTSTDADTAGAMLDQISEFGFASDFNMSALVVFTAGRRLADDLNVEIVSYFCGRIAFYVG